MYLNKLAQFRDLIPAFSYLALTHRRGSAGAEGCPASWMGVQGSHAERAVARRSVGPGADLIGLESSPLPMLHLCVRACLSSSSFLFLFITAFLYAVKVTFCAVRAINIDLSTVFACNLCVGTRGFFCTGQSVRMYGLGTPLPCVCVRVSLGAVSICVCPVGLGPLP